MGDVYEPPVCEGCGQPILRLEWAGLFTEPVEVGQDGAQPLMGRGRTAWFHRSHRPRHWSPAREGEYPESPHPNNC